jgi:lysophospholipid acyltransferase (LPLAT)-like uncharacterized protein
MLPPARGASVALGIEMKRLLRHPIVLGVIAALLSRYLEFALRTTRWTLDGADHAAPHLAGQSAIAAFWHERLPLMPALWRLADRPDNRRVHVLISRHQDGRFIARMVARFGMNVVHGSSARNGQDRGGAAGMRLMLEHLAQGDHVAITPDGPRGPRRVAAPGVAQLAALSGIVVLPCSAQTSRRIVVNSWDRMVVPLPFGRGVLVCLPTIPVGRDAAIAALPAITDALTAAADRADRLCR